MTHRYYLSEMSVSAMHGGGLTLHRVLQDDLDDFDRFVHLTIFASHDAPIIGRLADRQMNVHELVPRPGWTGRYTSRAQHLDRGWAKLRGISWEAWAIDWWVRRCARRIMRDLPMRDSLWLVVPQDVWAVRVANEIWKRARWQAMPFRYVTWIMDDHMVRWNGGWQYPPGFEAEFGSHLKHASRILVISDAMARMYAQRFGVTGSVLFGPSDPVNGAPLDAQAADGPVRLSYFGAVRPWQRDALALLVASLDAANATLDVFGLQDVPAEIRSQRVTIRPPVPPADVMGLMRKYDGVVIAASFLPELRHLTELNVATKMSECYASGTVPVIAAPEYAAMVQFARTHGGSVVITDFGDQAQLAPLKNLKSPSVRSRLLLEARHVAQTVTNISSMRAVWDKTWKDATRGAPTARAEQP